MCWSVLQVSILLLQHFLNNSSYFSIYVSSILIFTVFVDSDDFMSKYLLSSKFLWFMDSSGRCLPFCLAKSSC